MYKGYPIGIVFIISGIHYTLLGIPGKHLNDLSKGRLAPFRIFSQTTSASLIKFGSYRRLIRADMHETGYLPFERAVLVVRPLMLLKSLLTVELLFAALLSTFEKHLASFIYTHTAQVRHLSNVPCMIESY